MARGAARGTNEKGRARAPTTPRARDGDGARDATRTDAGDRPDAERRDDDDDDDVERARKRRATARAARLGFFGALRKAVERRALMMESDSSDDYDSDEDAAPERARAERRQSAWARAVGESDADELEKMMSDLSGAREMAMRMRSDIGGGGDAEEDATTAERERGAKREVEATPATSEMKRGDEDDGSGGMAIAKRVAYEVGATGAAMFSSAGEATNEDEDGSAGSIFVDVRMIQCLSGLFIRVNVESGSGLLAMDAGETSDPYVKVSIVNSAGLAVDGQVHRTGYRPKTTNPVWNESFYMGSEKLRYKDCSLKFEVYDFDLMSADDAMGSATLPLTHFAKMKANFKDVKSVKDTDAKVIDPSPSLADALSKSPSQVPAAALHLHKVKNTPENRAPTHFDDGYFVERNSNELVVHFKLRPPRTSSFIFEEAKAMLSFAKQLVDPRNFGKSFNQTGVGLWLNSKVEQAVDVGKRRALKVIDATIEEKKNKVCELAVADRDMPSVIRNYLAGVVNMYISDIQQGLMSDLGIRLKILDSAKSQGSAQADQNDAEQVKRRSVPQSFSMKRSVFGLFESIRCWYLYNEVPGDLSIFGKVRNPYWWLFLVSKLYFGLGLQAFVFFIRLALVDRRDEWQMFEYIMVFKGIQFISGTISVFAGVFAFIQCAGVRDAGTTHTCDTTGPWVTEMQSCAIDSSTCVALNVGAYLVRIMMCWYAFHKLRRSFAFGRAIASDHRLVGARIRITTVGIGSRYKTYGALKKALKYIFVKRKETPLERFRRIVNLQLERLAAAKGIRGGTARARNAFKSFHYVHRIAKVKDYDVASGMHTLYYKDDRTRQRHQIDLGTVTYTVMKLKHIQPRRVQRILWIYELVTFAVTVGCSIRFLAWVDWGRGETWQLYGVAFWGQTLYNLLAFPFILMVIPGVNKLICHAPKTGYDRNGNLKRFRKRATFEEDIEDEPNPRSRCAPACYPFVKPWRV